MTLLRRPGIRAPMGSVIVEDLPAEAKIEVLGEERSLEVSGGRFSDAFEAHAVHLYRVRGK